MSVLCRYDLGAEEKLYYLFNFSSKFSVKKRKKQEGYRI